MNVAMQARYKGRQFIINLRAVKGVFGLVQAPVKLDSGGKMILQLSGAERSVRTVQLFVTIEKKYHMEATFVLSLDKVVSPTGSTALLTFISEALGMRQEAEYFLEHDLVSGEMVYYEFKSGELHMPNQGKVISRMADVQARARRKEQELAERAEMAEIARTAQARNGTSGDAVADEHSDELIEMYGMKVSKKNLERLDTLGAPPEERSARRSAAPRSPEFTPPVTPELSDDAEKAPGKFSSLLRKLATKLTDEQ